MMRTFLSALALLAALLLAAAAAAAPALDRDGPVAFLGLTFLDTSTEGAYFGERPEERARIGLLEEAVRARFAEEGFSLLDLDPVAEELARTKNPARCYGCELRMGAKLGARYVLVGEVQKISNLILSMNLVMREVESGAVVRGMAVDIRSNTDDSWLRGMRYILNNHFFRDPPP